MPRGIFSVPKTRTVSYCPARMAAAASIERGAPTGAAGLDVDDGHAGHAETAEHLVPGGHPAVGRAAEGGLEVALADARPRCSAARTATTPMSVVETPSKRPKGCRPTPATVTLGHAGAKA